MNNAEKHLVFVYGVSHRGNSMGCKGMGVYLGAADVTGYWLYELSAMGRSYALPAHPGHPDPAPLSKEAYEMGSEELQETDHIHGISSGLYKGLKIAPTRIESGDWEHRGVECGKA